MSPEFGSTCAIFPIDAETLRYLAFTGRDPRADRAGRGLRQGAGPVARRGRRRADLHRDARARPGDGRAEHRRPEAPAGPRLADRVQGRPSGSRSRATCPTTIHEDEALAESLPGQRPGLARTFPTATATSPPAATGGTQVADRPADQAPGDAGRRDRDRARPRPRRDRRDHQLHQHLEPVGDARRRAPGPQRRAARAEGQALGEDLAGPGLQGRHRVPRPRRADRVSRRARASTWSATAAPPASATAARCPRRSPTRSATEDLAVVVGAVGQPQLRGPDQPRREDELPRLAAAVRRLRARRHDGRRPLRRAARRRTATASRCSSRTSGRARRGRTDGRGRPSQSDMFRKSYGEVFDGRRALEQSLEVPAGRRRFAWDAALDLRAPAAVLRRACRASPSRSSDIDGRARAGRARRQRHHRPHLARPARSSATARPAST